MWLGSGVAVAVLQDAAAAKIQPLVWELPYATSGALKNSNKNKNQKKKERKKKKMRTSDKECFRTKVKLNRQCQARIIYVDILGQREEVQIRF